MLSIIFHCLVTLSLQFSPKQTTSLNFYGIILCPHSAKYSCGIKQFWFRQIVQDATARLVSGTRRYDHIMPVLQELHWLPVRCRVDFKMARSPRSTRHCPAWFQPIWPPTVSWSPTKVVVSCVLSHQGRVLSDGPKATMEAGVLQLQVRSCGTAFQLNCDKLTLAFNDLSGY